jgi:cytidylate kinase
MAVVTISREYGSDGTQIAESVAAQLGALAGDKEILAQMAHQAGVSVDVIVRAEAQLLASPVAVSDEMRALMSARGGRSLNQAHFVHLTSEAIKLLAAQDKLVIVGRAGQIILKDHPGALHVHLYAPPQLRAVRIQQRRSLPNAEAALRMVQQADEQRRNWFRHFFSGVDWKSAKHYHLMIDTGRIPAAVATTIIVQAAGS